MKILSAEFVKSALRHEHFPRDGRPEFAFVGRSNVGKSSLLNALLNRKGMAKTSSTPGKTQTINYFEINGKFYFVDLPGYGFARVSKALKRDWQEAMTSYLMGREPLRLAVQLIDSRHPPTPKDLEMLALLEEAEAPTLIVATKIDKLKAGERARSLVTIRKVLELDDESAIIPFSAVTREGVVPILDIIEDCLKRKS